MILSRIRERILFYIIFELAAISPRLPALTAAPDKEFLHFMAVMLWRAQFDDIAVATAKISLKIYGIILSVIELPADTLRWWLLNMHRMRYRRVRPYMLLLSITT